MSDIKPNETTIGKAANPFNQNSPVVNRYEADLSVANNFKLKKPKVLIVDDEEDFAITLKEILEIKGYEAVIANTARAALKLIAPEPKMDLAIAPTIFDLALIDLNLPDLPGLELIQSFKLYSPFTELVVITGNPTLPTAIKALNLGAFGYIEKPYNVDRLFILLERALEHQRLLRSLQESEARYRRLFDELGAAMFILDLKTDEIWHPNKGFSKLFGYTEPEIVDGRISLKDFLSSPEDYARFAGTKAKLLQEGFVSQELQLRRRGGIPFWALLHFTRLDFTIIPGSANKTDSVALTLVLDLTKRKTAEAELLKTKSYLEAIFAGIGSGVCIIDSDYKILDANPAYFKLVGVEREIAIGKRCYEIHHNRKTPCHHSGEVCPIQNCKASLVKSQVYHEHKTANGDVRYLEITVTPLKDESGNLTSFIGVLNDLTEIRKVQSELELLNQELIGQREKLLATATQLEKANAELVKLSEAKSEFISAVSHELRTPLTAIMEGISLVEDGSLGPINSDQKRFLILTKNNAKRLADLINDLLDLSKIEAGRYELTPQKLDLTKAVRELAQNLGPLVTEKGLTLRLELPNQLPKVFADERSLFRILMNLLSNAVKFTPPGGQITIQAEARCVPNKNEEVVVSVIDTGIGIPKEQQDKLFVKFQQITRPGETRPTGTGLGLALTKELVLMNQGKIWVESDEGKGSKFSFSLPVYDEFEDLKRTFATIQRNCRQASVRLRLMFFAVKIIPPNLHQEQLELVLDSIEKVIRSKITRFDIVRRVKSQGLIGVLSPAHETKDDTDSDGIGRILYQQIVEFLSGMTFLVDSKEVSVKIKSHYQVIKPDADITIDQILKTRGNWQEIRK
ncbi:MAG: ATP-binding protein [candidate division WOR-3 bacterium]